MNSLIIRLALGCALTFSHIYRAIAEQKDCADTRLYAPHLHSSGLLRDMKIAAPWIPQEQCDAFPIAVEVQFIKQVHDFLKNKFPEAAGMDVKSGECNALALIFKASQFDLTSPASVISFIEFWLGHFIYEPEAYRWAFDLLSDPDVAEEEKILGIEDRLYAVKLRNNAAEITPEQMAQLASDNATAQRALVKRLQALDDFIRTVNAKYGCVETASCPESERPCLEAAKTELP